MKSTLAAFGLAILTLAQPATTAAQPAIDWLQVYAHAGITIGSDAATAMALDVEGNTYVAGTSGGRATIIKYGPDGTELWTRQHDETQGSPTFRDLAVGAAGDLHAAGSIRLDGDARAILATYSSSGSLLWQRIDAVPGRDSWAGHVQAAPGGDVVLAGGRDANAGETHIDIFVARYDAGGNLLWEREYVDDYDDVVLDLLVDSHGNVFVTGDSEYLTHDFVTIKYGPDGNDEWTCFYNGPDNDNDGATALALSNDETRLHVTGRVGMQHGDGTYYHDWATVQYHAGTGEQLWASLLGTEPSDNNGGPASILVDENGAVYVTGSMGVSEDGQTLRYDSATVAYAPDGAVLWSVRRTSEPGGRDRTRGSAFGIDGSIIVAGSKTSTLGHPDSDFLLRAYDRSGNELWELTYAGPARAEDRLAGFDIATDGGIHVAGSLSTAAERQVWATIRYGAEPASMGQRSAGHDPPLLSLRGARPNPARRSAAIEFHLERPTAVRIDLYDVRGSRVRSLSPGSLAAGTHVIAWDGTGANGAPIANGVYLYRVSAGGGVAAEGKLVWSW